jgi:hypothetical protein
MATPDAPRMTNRARYLRVINDCFGIDSDLGREILLDVAARYILEMLPDHAVAEIAMRHQQAERRAAEADRRMLGDG